MNNLYIIIKSFSISLQKSTTHSLSLCFFFLLILLSFSPCQAQEADSLKNDQEHLPVEALAVFLDCKSCDITYIRREITFVNYARDPQLAQVHVFITEQRTGSGGKTFTISFIGKKEFEGINNSLKYTSLQTNTLDEERQGLTTMLKLGLVPYIAHTPLASQVSLTFKEMQNEVTTPKGSWNHWIFEVYGGGNFDKEARKSAFNLRYGLYANRVTERWRIRTHPYFNYNRRLFNNNGQIISSILHRNGFNGSVVRSISNHWSAGFFTEIYSTTYSNIDLGMELAPALEYSLFPYSEATRKEITVAYTVGYLRRKYMQETIYSRFRESLMNQAIEISVRIRQPWGSITAELEGSHFFHDLSKNRIEFNSYVSLRILKGLSLSLAANFDVVRDQLALPKGEASLEDILLQQRQLATTYNIYLSVGLSYTFGSIYNNVVNTRL